MEWITIEHALNTYDKQINIELVNGTCYRFDLTLVT